MGPKQKNNFTKYKVLTFSTFLWLLMFCWLCNGGFVLLCFGAFTRVKHLKLSKSIRETSSSFHVFVCLLLLYRNDWTLIKWCTSGSGSSFKHFIDPHPVPLSFLFEVFFQMSAAAPSCGNVYRAGSVHVGLVHVGVAILKQEMDTNTNLLQGSHQQ